MDIEDIIQLFESEDISKPSRIFTENGLILTHIQRHDNHSMPIEEGQEIVALYRWNPVAEPNNVKSVIFHKWRENNDLDILEIKLNGKEIYNQLINELSTRKDFKRSYLRRKHGKDTRFLNAETKVNFEFMHREWEDPRITESDYYLMIVLRNQYAYKK